MGPDCGTAIIGGVGIGFSNAVRRGPIGVIGASGTGIQELSTLVHLSGSGISHAIGTGSRDLSDAIGGISLLSAFDALESDTSTKVIAILSKPPGRLALSNLVSRIIHCQKPVITCFLGLREDPPYANIRFRNAHTLEDAASIAVEMATGIPLPRFNSNSPDLKALIQAERAGKKSEQKYIRGLFAGGTFCYQAQQILQDAGMVAYSNAPLNGNLKLADPMKSDEHTLVDMGADEFTAGRPHPMIDSRLRCERLLFEAQDPEVATLLLDFVLGFNSSPDPAGDLVSAIAEAKREVRNRGGSLSVVASVCGTEEDPQNLQHQLNLLEEAGVIVFSSSTQAARFCTLLASSS
jgi:succinyl-CoA synthetase alpha subunit